MMSGVRNPPPHFFGAVRDEILFSRAKEKGITKVEEERESRVSLQKVKGISFFSSVKKMRESEREGDMIFSLFKSHVFCA